jgi:hypothetical protein
MEHTSRDRTAQRRWIVAGRWNVESSVERSRGRLLDHGWERVAERHAGRRTPGAGLAPPARRGVTLGSDGALHDSTTGQVWRLPLSAGACE